MPSAVMPVIAILVALSAASAQAQDARPDRGRSIAVDRCAACHAIDRGQLRSPRPDAAPFRAIAAAPGMTELALAASLQTSHRTMPDLILEPADLRDVIAYVLSLR